MKLELIAKLEELLSKDAGEVAFEVRALQKEYQKQWTTDFEKAKQTFIDEGGKSKEFEYHKQPEDLKFESLIEKFNKLKKEADAKIAAEQEKNLKIRLEIIAKIKDLKESENVGAAIRKLTELQAQWKETGAVSPHKYKEIQAEYSRAMEDIHYNLKIFRDLQEHDLKKNFEAKSELINKVKGLQTLENVKEAERLIKVYRNEWDEIGPVPNAKWETLKAEYKAALDEAYAKIKSFYHGIEELQEQNLKAKQEIIEKVKAIAENIVGADKISKWNEATDNIIALQAEWKNIGKVSAKDNEKIWAEFRSVCDDFFEKKKEFYAGLNEKHEVSRKIKRDLIAAAEALKDSTDWKATGEKLIKLQETWKKHPSNGDKEEPKLFARFRKACNTFFDAKKNYYESLDASYEKNLAVKEEILSRFNAFTLGEDSKANHEQLKAFSAEWKNAGLVPIKDKKRLNDAFYNRLEELYDKMNLDKHEKMMMQFRAKLDRLSASENGMDLLRKEADFLKKQIDEINNQLRTYENNLGFFKTSKGSNSFMKEIEEKVELEKNKIAELNNKRKLVNEEMAKLRDIAEKPKAEA